MCDDLSISLILRKKLLNLSKNVSIPGVDEEKPKDGGGGGGGGRGFMPYVMRLCQNFLYWCSEKYFLIFI